LCELVRDAEASSEARRPGPRRRVARAPRAR
jgi:hypothetical protein